MTEHFTFFESYYQSVKDLPAEIKAEFYDVLFNYALYDDDISSEANPIVKALFLMAKPNLDKSKARREAGKQGGSKTKQTEANVSKTKQTSSDKEKDKDKEKEKDINNAFSFNNSKAIQYNSLSKIYQDKLYGYAVVKDGAFQFDAFLDSHISKGNKFKDWSRAYNTWVKNSVEFSKGQYNPEMYRKEMNDHPDYEAVYVPYGQKKAYSKDYDYICSFEVSEPLKSVTGNEPEYNPEKNVLELIRSKA